MTRYFAPNRERNPDSYNILSSSSRLTEEKDVKDMVTETPVELRPGLDVLIRKCKDNNIPFLIFSAGIANVIEEVLTTRNLYHRNNMHIISNQMGFNSETGICDHFKVPLIHIFNKSEIIIKNSPYYTTIKNRGNVILLGDSIGDIHMADGIQHNICLTVGFLNHNVEDYINTYLETFDIVVVDDGPMDTIAFQNVIYKTTRKYPTVSPASNIYANKGNQSTSLSAIYRLPSWSTIFSSTSKHANDNSIISTRGFNPKTFNCKPPNYEIWTSTEISNRRLDKAFWDKADKGPIYLFFSVNASYVNGRFCGMAEMLTPVDYTSSYSVLEKDKGWGWGVIKVKWIFVKDIPNGQLRHIRVGNNENKPITNSRDTQELYSEPGRNMVKIFFDYRSKTSILNDSKFYDKRQVKMQRLIAQQRSASPE
ncbi:5814_t:CDS:2, partial [Dentiscutata erythropus]